MQLSFGCVIVNFEVREMDAKGMNQVFDTLCKKLQDWHGLVYSEFGEEKNMRLFSMYYRVVKIQLVYSRRWEDLAPPSVLYCRVFLRKNEPVYFHLTDVLGYLNIKDFRACCFPYIANEQRMKAAINALMAVLDDHLEEIQTFALSSGAEELLKQWYSNGLISSNNELLPAEQLEKPIPEAITMMLKTQEAFRVSRYTAMGAYQSFINGQREEAIRGYEKLSKKGLTQYEWALLEFLKSKESVGFLPIPPSCRNPVSYKQPMGSKEDFLGVCVCWLVTAALMCATIAIANGVINRGAVYVYGIEWYFGILLSMLCGLFGYMGFRREILRRVPGKNKQQRNEMLDMEKPSRVISGIAKVVAIAALVGGLYCCLSFPQMSDRFYDTYGTYYTQAGTERFEYADVTQAYCISARYNVYGDRVERSSCVLILKDGRQIDLDGCGDAENQRKLIGELIPGMVILEVDSDRDLP